MGSQKKNEFDSGSEIYNQNFELRHEGKLVFLDDLIQTYDESNL